MHLKSTTVTYSFDDTFVSLPLAKMPMSDSKKG